MSTGRAGKQKESRQPVAPVPARDARASVSFAPPPYRVELADRQAAAGGRGFPVQRRAEVRGLEDPLEREADRAAEAALARLTPTRTPAAPPPPVQQAAAPAIQRAADPEREAEAAASAALSGEPEVEGGHPEDEEDEGAPAEDDEGDEGDVIQAKLDGGASALQPGDAMGVVRRGIATASGGGRALDEPVRGRMERAFDADFSGVRVHTDPAAAALARTAHALAFTSGRDLFFAERRYQPSSPDGERLLAHELAHVLQQRAAPMFRHAPLAPAEPGAVQRKDGPGERFIGYLYLYDAKDKLITEGEIGEMTALKIPPGLYAVTIRRTSNEVYLSIQGGLTYTFGSFNIPDEMLRRAKSIRLLIVDTAQQEKPPADKKPEKPTVDDPTGRGGKTDEETDEEKQGQGDEDKKGTEEGKKGGEEGGKGKDGEGKGKEGEGKKGGIPGLPGKLGSKYGVFGLLDLPQWLIKALEQVVDLLGDPEELEAIVDLLRAIRDIADNADELKGMFKDSSALLEIALGIQDNAAVDAIQSWVESDHSRPGKSRKPKLKMPGKGFAKLAAQVVRVVAKIRRMLKPVFKVRRGVQAVLGGIGLILESISTLERLFEMTAQVKSKFSLEEVRATAIQFTSELAAAFKQQIENLPATLKGGFEQFSKSDFVSREALAEAVAAGLAMFFKRVPLAKPLIRSVMAQLLTVILPESAHQAVNDAIGSLIKDAQPAFDRAVDDFGKILKDLDMGFLSEMPEAVLDALKPSSKTGERPARAPIGVAGAMLASAGEPLDEGVRTEAETRLGHSFDGVRIHRDAAAAEASEQLGARAFTLGGDVYFGPGRFAPESQEGRRLLYHELAHVGQQAEEGETDLRFDYKDLLKKLSKKVSASVITALKGATASSPKKQKQAADIKNKVEKLIGRAVVSRTNPKLPTGYSYIPKKKGKIKTIRRTLAWIRFIPALTIKKGRIKLAATLSKYDPKAAARAMLRRALGCTGKQEAHHVVPLELLLHSVVIDAVKHGWNFNGRANGLCVSDKIHSGSHPIYTADVRARLDRLPKGPIDFSKPNNPFFLLVDDLKAEVRKRRRKLN